MQQYGTITSKNQITIPAKIAKKLNLKPGEKVKKKKKNGDIIITSAVALVEKLAGSVKLPKRWQGKDVDEVIELAKYEYFKKKHRLK